MKLRSNDYWRAALLLVFCVHMQSISVSAHYTLRRAREPFRLTAFRSCLRVSGVSVASTVYEFDPDPENAYGTVNGQWELQLENLSHQRQLDPPVAMAMTVAFFFPRSPTHLQPAVRCAERLGLRLERKRRRNLPDLVSLAAADKTAEAASAHAHARDLKILHQSDAGLVFEQFNPTEGAGAAGLRERCVSHNHKPDSVDTCVDPAWPERILVPYIRMLFGALYLRGLPRLERVLMIGLGGGSFPTSFYKLKAGIEFEMDIVELDGAMPELASQWFHFKPSPGTQVHVEDGAEFIKHQADGIYDLIVVDAYDDEGEVPTAIASKEFGQELLRVLKQDGGVAALNLFKGTGKKLRDFVRSRFGSVFELRDGHSTVMLAVAGAAPTEVPAMTTEEEIRARARDLAQQFEEINIDTKWLLKKFNIALN